MTTPYLHPDAVITRLREDLAAVGSIVSRWEEDSKPVRRATVNRLENAHVRSDDIDDRFGPALVKTKDSLDEAHRGLTALLAAVEDAEKRLRWAKRDQQPAGRPVFRIDR